MALFINFNKRNYSWSNLDVFLFRTQPLEMQYLIFMVENFKTQHSKLIVCTQLDKILTTFGKQMIMVSSNFLFAVTSVIIFQNLLFLWNMIIPSFCFMLRQY